MSEYFRKTTKNVIDQIRYRGTIVTGEITVDNGDDTYDVKIANANVAFPNVETILYGETFSIGEIVMIGNEYGSKEAPKIIGHAKKIAQNPVQVEVDYSGSGGDPITTVTTLDAYLETEISAYVEGKIELSNGAGNCTCRGFKYGLNTAYGSDIHEDGSYGAGYFNGQITGLDSNTTYHFQAYVLDANGDKQTGNDKTMTTKGTIFTDIGSPAIVRPYITGGGLTTVILKENPANGDGKITSLEIYTRDNITSVRVATFIRISTNVFTARDSQTIGTVVGGSKQTFSVNIDVKEGDYIGICRSGGALYTTPSGEGVWTAGGDQTQGNEVTFNFSNNFTLSVYGTG